MNETSKIIKQLTIAVGKPELLDIKHKGARRSLCLQAIRKAYNGWLDSQFKKIELRIIPVKKNGKIIGYL